MPYDSLVMAAVMAEIRRDALDGQVARVFQPAPDEILLHLRAGGTRLPLLFSTHPHRFRVHFVRETPPNPPSPPQFCMALRKHLEGARLIHVEQAGLERIARFRFERSDGARVLVAEMMGKHSNLILLDEHDRILDSIKHVGGRVNRFREILPNRPYVPPPSPTKPDPLLSGLDEIAAALAAAGERVTPPSLVRAVANVGPFLAQEALSRAASHEPGHVAAALMEMMARVRREEFAPSLLMGEAGHPHDAWAFECRSVPEERQEVAPSMSLALEVGRHHQARAEDLERLRAEVREGLSSALDRSRRRLRELGEALQKAEQAEEYKIKGEILQAHAHLPAKGQAEVDLPNYYDPDLAPIRIELDPLLSPQENAEAYFRRHRKAKSALPVLTERCREEERKQSEWQAILSELDDAGADRLRTLLREMGPEMPADSDGGKAAGEETRKPAAGVRRTRSSDGYEIWYGEHKEGNDTLTTKFAAPTDIWLHVRAGASAHVVIRSQKRPEAVPQKTLMEAARIAAAHSESKHSKVVPVDYTLKKYVRKPRGSGPGQAFYTHEKTLHVEQD